MKITAVILLALLVNSCKDENEQQPQAGATPAHGFTLAIEGIAAEVDVGSTSDIVVQIKQGGIEFTGAEKTIEVSLLIVCGNNKNEKKQTANDKGVATFAAFTFASSWRGDCTATATATVAGHDLQQQVGFTLNEEKSSNEAQMLQLTAGLAYAANSFKDSSGRIYNGFLALQACDNAQVLAVTENDSNPIESGNGSGVPINDKKRWQYIVVGEIPSGCQLMFASSAGGTKQAIGDVKAAPVGLNVAQGKITALQKNNSKKLTVTTAQVSNGSLYVYDSDNNTWHSVKNVRWNNETATQSNWSLLASDNRALLKVTDNDKQWWYLAVASIVISTVKAGIGGGKLFTISGAGSDAIAVQVEKACGLKVFRLNVANNKASLLAISATAVNFTPNSEGVIAKLFAYGTPQAGCDFALRVGGTVAVATETIAHTYPILKLERQGGSGHFMISSDARGMVRPLYVSNTGSGGFRFSMAQWRLDTRTTISFRWNDNDASQNQVLAIHAGTEVFYTRGE